MAKKTTIDSDTGEVLAEADAPDPVARGAGTAVSVSHLSSPDAITEALARLGFKAKRAVTRPLLKFDQRPVLIEIQSHFYQGKELPESKMAAPLMMDVRDLMTGTDCQAIVGAVLQSELARAYGNDRAQSVYDDRRSKDADRLAVAGDIDIVGRRFMIARIPADGKRYSVYSVTELDNA